MNLLDMVQSPSPVFGQIAGLNRKHGHFSRDIFIAKSSDLERRKSNTFPSQEHRNTQWLVAAVMLPPEVVSLKEFFPPQKCCLKPPCRLSARNVVCCPEKTFCARTEPQLTDGTGENAEMWYELESTTIHLVEHLRDIVQD